MITLNEAARFLEAHDNYHILTHAYPDGDTLGSGFALCRALKQIGKKATVITTGVPDKFKFLTEDLTEEEVPADTVVSVDVAADSLLGDNMGGYKGSIDLCIDHHGTNSIEAKSKYVDANAAANCEILYELFLLMNTNITPDIADCLYTGLATDTGCFRFTNVTSKTMRTAADLMDLGCNTEYINKVMFETKTKSRVALERAVYDTISYHADGKCAIVCVTLDTMKKLGIDDSGIEGIEAISRQIAGVLLGITIKEKEGGFFKVSARTNGKTDAAAFCARFGGGGHFAAAGCKLSGTYNEVKARIVNAAEEFLKGTSAIEN